jgi:hypothetical protein
MWATDELGQAATRAAVTASRPLTPLGARNAAAQLAVGDAGGVGVDGVGPEGGVTNGVRVDGVGADGVAPPSDVVAASMFRLHDTVATVISAPRNATPRTIAAHLIAASAECQPGSRPLAKPTLPDRTEDRQSREPGMSAELLDAD